MPKSNRPSPQSEVPKELTLMFYFASDNPLAPGILSQLKSIQQAGFHPDINVIAQYDPQTERAPLHVFDVNKVEKLKARKTKQPFQIGFKPDNSFVPNLVLDKLWIDEDDIEMVRAAIGPAGENYKQPPPPNSRRKKSAAEDGQEPSPKDSLSNFLEFCRKSYPARRYMLFILGHGLVVGNDMFLFDEHAAQRSVSLNDLGKLLGDFRKQVNKDGQAFEFLSLHSCSMSALEVAYELKNTASYMLASQGPAFVGSWPYRQILMRVFQDVVEKEKDVKTTLGKIFNYCLHNSRDFQLAGYSFDLCLCDLSKVPDIKTPLRKLSATLKSALSDRAAQDCILLAHWDAQSYWGESYTDLYDYCLRLIQRCQDAQDSSKKANATLRAIQRDCCDVIKTLEPGSEKLIIETGTAGGEFQFSHGLSVFFPWSAPGGKFWPKEYGSYKFNAKNKGTRWIEFLDEYFRSTMRDPRGSESVEKGKSVRKPRTHEVLLDRMALRGLVSGGQLGSDGSDDKGSGSDVTGGDGSGTEGVDKGSGSDATGGLGFASIKNYPPHTLVSVGKRESVREPYECPE